MAELGLAGWLVRLPGRWDVTGHAYPHCDARSGTEYRGFYWLIESTDPRLRTIQKFIRSWQRAGGRENVVPLVLDDIRRVLA